jgi:LysM repeat protein
MNTPNPLIPQGTFPDNRGKSHIRIAVFTILAIHVVLLGALLMAGCKKTADSGPDVSSLATNFPPPPPLAPIETNPPTPVVTPSAVLTPTPVPVPLPPPEPIPVGTEHVVVKGDSFYTLAKKYNVSSKAIAEANPGVDSAKLKIGQKLKIPAGTPSSVSTVSANGNSANGSDKTYTVKSGDTLMKIAKDSGVTLKSLRSANNLKTDQIKVGQKLKIPGKIPLPTETLPSAGAAATTAPPSVVP